MFLPNDDFSLLCDAYAAYIHIILHSIFLQLIYVLMELSTTQDYIQH